VFLRHVREGNDWLLADKPEPDGEGTFVTLTIDPQSTHTTQEVFDKYATAQDDYAFGRTHVMVQLAKTGEERFVSRSQAKRIVARLDRFREVILDFTNVTEIGPAFADEVFRVYASQHPQTQIIPVNQNEQVSRMIRRATDHAAGPDATS
jgi:hypothetical protein